MLPLSIYLGTKNWICNNLFGIAFTVSGIANFTVIPNFKVCIYKLIIYKIDSLYDALGFILL